LGRNPGKQIISASYNSDLAADFGRDVRNTVADDLYQQVFPGMGLRQDSKAADRWNTLNGGCYVSAGVGSGITGRGADLGLIDDPFKDRQEANSANTRERVWNWYISTFYTRLMPNAAIVITLTRWHEDDLAGRLLNAQKDGGDQWTVLSLPALATGPDELGREDNQPLWPDWYPLDTLNQIKKTIGNYEFSALYQQSPYIEEGNIFRRSWWQYYRETPRKYNMVIQSWDTAFKVGEENDFSCCTTWGVIGSQIHLMDRWLGKLEFPELKRMAISLAVRFAPVAILIEDKASGQSLIQELRRESKLNLIPRKADRDKVSRAHSVSPLIEGGQVFLPEWGSWVQEYINQMAAFPSSAHDDDVDSTTQALEYLRNKAHSYGQHQSPKVLADYTPANWR
jgi:predicted phage terminase large subunit-like protein